MMKLIAAFIVVCCWKTSLGAQEVERMPRTQAKMAHLKHQLRDIAGEKYDAAKSHHHKLKQTADDTVQVNETVPAGHDQPQDQGECRSNLDPAAVTLHYFAAKETPDKLKGPFVTTCSGVNPSVASLAVLGRAKAREKVKRKLAQQSANSFTFQEVGTMPPLPDPLQIDALEEEIE
jgi:hypothetical protein